MMYFLKCTHCGFENPIKTEYVTFCGHCSKKLPFNFPEWSKQNPGKNFEEFCKTIGHVPQSSLPLTRRSKTPLVIGLITGVLIIIATGAWLYFSSGGDIAGIFLPGNTPAAVLKGNWQRHTYGKFGLSIETPEKLLKRELNIPGIHQSRVSEIESFYYRPSKGFQVVITSVLYEAGIAVNLEGAAAGSINELINQPGVTNVEFNQSPLMYNDVRGMLLDGSFHDNGIFRRFQCAVYGRRSNMWSVWVAYRDTDNNGKKAAQRIIESIEINYFVKAI